MKDWVLPVRIEVGKAREIEIAFVLTDDWFCPGNHRGAYGNDAEQ